MSVNGLRFSGHDNYSTMYGPTAAVLRCNGCNRVLERDIIDPEFNLVRQGYDVSVTFDSVIIVSTRFKQFCELQGYKYLEFFHLAKHPDYYALIVRAPVVAYDIQRRRTRFEELCHSCNRYFSVIGSSPVFLVDNATLGYSFYCSDLAFGSGDAQAQMILVGPGIQGEIARQRFRGVHWKAVSE